MFTKEKKRKRRHQRIRSVVSGTAEVPRLVVYRSARHIYGQLIDDVNNKVLISVKDLDVDKVPSKENRKITLAYEVGKILAKKAQEQGIEKVVFDRAGYKYHGRVKALAEGAREAGLKF